jgi:hypothetical protein
MYNEPIPIPRKLGYVFDCKSEGWRGKVIVLSLLGNGVNYIAMIFKGISF